jgi:hypothetical protein
MFDYKLLALSHSRLASELTREDWEGLQAGDLIAFRDDDSASLLASKYLVPRGSERDKAGQEWEIYEVFSATQRRAI